MTAATVSGTTGEGRRASVAPAGGGRPAAAADQEVARLWRMMTCGGAAVGNDGWLDGGAAPAVTLARRSGGSGVVNDVEQRLGGALPDRSIPDETIVGYRARISRREWDILERHLRLFEILRRAEGRR
ncbi:hypothetical protein Scep_024123 [Stephania cephalantha]|uniref:Uncharacterized protein n=1 Tax=Stephania cephalantha TaxID=152367 RepID=A0AAP0HTE7_9MAGN